MTIGCLLCKKYANSRPFHSNFPNCQLSYVKRYQQGLGEDQGKPFCTAFKVLPKTFCGNEDKPRTNQGQAKDEKHLRRAATEGNCNFTNNILGSVNGHYNNYTYNLGIIFELLLTCDVMVHFM